MESIPTERNNLPSSCCAFFCLLAKAARFRGSPVSTSITSPVSASLSSTLPIAGKCISNRSMTCTATTSWRRLACLREVTEAYFKTSDKTTSRRRWAEISLRVGAVWPMKSEITTAIALCVVTRLRNFRAQLISVPRRAG